MKVLDMLNFKWYEKRDLIEESTKAFLNDRVCETRKEALKKAKEYVNENSLTMSEAAKWIEERA